MTGNSPSKVIGVLLGGVALGGVLGTGITLQMKKQGSSAGTSAGATCSVDGAGSASSALFELDGKTYSAEELPTQARDTLFQIQTQSFETASNFSRELALRIALAQEQKMDIAKDLPDLRALMKVEPPAEEELKKFYETNKQSMPPSATFEQIKPQLVQFMSSQKVGEQARTKATELTSAGRLKMLLKAPQAPVVSLPLERFPSKGSAEAIVTLVETSDYLCPHCRSTKPEVEAVLKEFGSKVRFHKATFALRPGQLSGVLARGAYCANQQSADAFWKYNDKAFEVPLEAANATSPDVQKEFVATAVKAAKDAGIDDKAFEACLGTEVASKWVEETNSILSGAGVNATPTFFLNNRRINLGSTTLAQAVKEAIEGGSTAANPSKAN
jgi:protein-disulfide isomerase